MLKRVILAVLMLCLILSLPVIAENTDSAQEELTFEVQEQMMQGAEEMPQGRENRGMPPSGNMENRGAPPEGMNRRQRPSGDFTPPENRGDFTPPQGDFTPPENGGDFTPPQGDFTPPENREESIPPQGGFTPPENEEKSTPPQNNDINNNAETTPQTDGDTAEETPRFGRQMPGGMGGFPGNMQNSNQNTQDQQETGFSGFIKTNSAPVASVILLGLAFLFVIFYKRKNY